MKIDDKMPAITRAVAAARRAFVAASALAVLLLGAAAWAAGPDHLSIRLDWTPWGDQAAFHLAQVKGWYRANNLDVEAFCANYPIPRAGRAEDVAREYAFLASDAASYITGQTLAVDGGPIVGGQGG